MERIKKFSHEMRTPGKVSIRLCHQKSPDVLYKFPDKSIAGGFTYGHCLFVCFIIICYLFQVFRKLPSTVRKIVSDPCCNMILGV